MTVVRISELTDDILVSIISRLPFVEAVATSFISTRWRYLYTYTFGLNFPPFKLMIKQVEKKRCISIRSRMEEQRKRFPDYINMINRVLDSHKGNEAKEFRVHVPCWPGANVDRWLEFAFSSKVEIINIHMDRTWMENIYSLGLVNLMKAAGGAVPPALGCLKQLSLSRVDVDDGELQILLSNSPLLESLSIECSDLLTNVCIVDHSLLLKHLSISGALNLKSVELGNLANLISFMCCDLPATYDLHLYNLPGLVELSTGVIYDNTLEQVWHRIPSCIRNQLQLLKFSVNPLPLNPDIVLPKLINVKHLVVEIVHMCHTCDTEGLFPLIEACCSLECVEIKFVWPLKTEYCYDEIFFEEEIMSKSRYEEYIVSKCSYDESFEEEEEIVECFSKRMRHSLITKRILRLQEILDWSPNNPLSANLKKLKISGYIGCISELFLSLFIMKNAVALEELNVEPFNLFEETRRTSTVRAWSHFQPVTPTSVNLVII